MTAVASPRRIVIEFLGQDKSLSSTAAGAERNVSTLGSKMAKVGKIAAVGLGVGAAVAAKGLFEMAKGAAEDQQAASMLAKTLKNSAGATKAQVAANEEWISKQGELLGVTDDELRPAMSKLVQATGDVGKAQKLAALGMDVAASRGMSLESVSKTLARAQGGQTAGLAKLGVATKDAAGKALSFDEIQKNMAKTFGGAAAEKADTLQGKMDRLKLRMSEAGEAIGYKLLPPAIKMADWFMATAVPAIGQFTASLQEKLGPVIEWVRGLFSSSTNGMSGDVSRNLGAIQATFQNVVSIIQSLWGAFGGTLTTYAVNTFQNIRTIIGGALEVIKGIFQVFSSLLKGDWAGVWEGIKSILSGAWTVIKGLVSQGWNAVKTLFSAAGIVLRATFSALWEGIKGLASAGVEKVVDAVRGIPGKLRELGGKFKSAGGDLMGKFVEGLKSIAGAAGDIAAGLWSGIKGYLNSAIDKINSAIPDKIGKGKLSVDLPNSPFPHFARGTKSAPGGLAIVGEEGPELVNLPRGSAVTPNNRLGAAVSGLQGIGGGGLTIIVQGALDPDAVGRQLVQILNRYVSATGQVPSFAGGTS